MKALNHMDGAKGGKNMYQNHNCQSIDNGARVRGKECWTRVDIGMGQRSLGTSMEGEGSHFVHQPCAVKKPGTLL